MIEDDHPRAARRRPAPQLLSHPGRHPGGVERLADHEQGGDVDRRSGRRTRPGPRRGRARPWPTATATTPIATTATGSRFHTNRTTAPPRTRNVMVLSAIRVESPVRGDGPRRRGGCRSVRLRRARREQEAQGRRPRTGPRRSRSATATHSSAPRTRRSRATSTHATSDAEGDGAADLVGSRSRGGHASSMSERGRVARAHRDAEQVPDDEEESQVTSTMTVYGIISEMIVPRPASFL